MSETTRREFLKDAVLTGATIAASSFAEGNLLASPVWDGRKVPPSPPAPAQNVMLSWLGEESPLVPTGISWGVPWPQGAVGPGATFNLSAQGQGPARAGRVARSRHPLQSY